MRSFSLVGILITAIGLGFALCSEASAAPGDFPYCANSRGFEENYTNCSFSTFDACLEELKGMRGYCSPNPYYVATPPLPTRSETRPRRTRSRE